ncbi:zinc finger protein 596-like [Choloepus didactylus]|uniref:zinc finger protein 596-like n=1 Tax=Choloepus didactylus TaxID=27675 RepID=UPI00189F0841|nr:zinc finger protein 596-like [Choloepus didactylus]XP_037673798.1 zinc finger protein 596-like [Choloepus didactylus]
MKTLESVTFNDIAIDFSTEEWNLMDTTQRKLFRDVMLESINHLVSVGYQLCKSEVVSQLEHGEELWRQGLGFLQGKSPGMENDHENEEMITMPHICNKDMSVIQSKQHISYTGGDLFERDDLEEDFIHSTLTDIGVNPYLNEQFQKPINYQSFFSRHKQIQTGHKSYDYHLCGKDFISISALRQYERSCTGEKPYVCHICGKDFTHNSTLRQHERTHTGEKPYVCHLCEKAFSDNSTLRRHERTHTGEKPYICYLCGKSFSQCYNLKQHERTHTGEKPHVCHLCGKSFTQRGNLRQHESAHTGEKPYVCHICGKGFTYRSTHRQHVRTHTGEKPYICHQCGKSFSQCRSLRQHGRTHTG